MGSMLHDGSFVSICVWNNWVLFNIFYRIGTSASTHCIWRLSYFFHIRKSPKSPHAHKVCTCPYDRVEDKDADNKALVFFHKSAHTHVARYLFNIQGPWTFHNNSSI